MSARAPGTPPFVVGLAGGSGSGKTSLARALAATLGTERVARLSHDAYYLDRSALPPAERAGMNYDVPEAFDQALFLAHLRALRAGAAVRPPRYCFARHCRVGEAEPVESKPVVVVDGILLLHDSAVRAALDLRVYVDAPERVRLERRIARDTQERGRTEGAVRHQFETTVRRAHAVYVEPTKALADLVLANMGPLPPLAEVAATLILDRLAARTAAPQVA